jgi:hypothetical protein
MYKEYNMQFKFIIQAFQIYIRNWVVWMYIIHAKNITGEINI